MQALIRFCKEMRPNTSFLLMAQYNGMAVIPLDLVCRDYFRHLTADKLLRKLLAGQISLPIVRIENSQKAAKGVHRGDLAAYIDKQRDKALEENGNFAAAITTAVRLEVLEALSIQANSRSRSHHQPAWLRNLIYCGIAMGEGYYTLGSR
jgi:hypothetical protein